MNITTINPKKCTSCEACVLECTPRLFSTNRTTKNVEFSDKHHACIGCGHCVAVCPTDAIEYDYENDNAPIPPAGRTTYTDMLSHLASRRSMRSYSKKKLSHEEIQKVLEAIRYSPSGSNQRSWSFIVITDPQQLQHLSEQVIKGFVFVRRLLAFKWLLHPFTSGPNKTLLKGKALEKSLERFIKDHAEGRDRILFDAPCLILLHSPSYGHLAGVDAGIAVTQGILAAHSLKLGTCWIGFLMEVLMYRPGLRKKLGIPKNERVWGAFTLGHPGIDYTSVAPRDKLRVRWIGT